MRALARSFFTLLSIFSVFLSAASGAGVNRSGSGAHPAAIQAVVDQFRADLGGANNGVGGSFRTGRREINWDGVPDSFSAPDFLPVDFFNINSPRGVVFSSRTTFGDSSAFIVSADSNNTTATPVRFANIDPSYSSIFQTFSAERLFIARNMNTLVVNFFIPGTNTPATVSGFGAVFTDVDNAGPTYIKYYGVDGGLLGAASLPTANGGLSFAGVSFNAGERVARVEIVSGNAIMANGVADNGSSSDLVAMDDFIYGEPRAATYREGDFDGDGTSDITVFRPSTGNWFTFQSGSNTVLIDSFGQAGDIPVAGDYDGDRLTDTAIYRPSLGQWWFKRSSNGTNFASTFGTSTDRPVPGDYDKDGKHDFAFHRPGTNEWFVARSVDNYGSFFSVPFGAAGDIPVGVTVNP